MSLVDRINADIKSAMLAKEKEKLEALRSIKAALLLAQSSGEPVTDDSEIKLLQKLVKQRREAAEIYKTQNRSDLAEPEIFQADIIQQYLPAQMGEEEIKNIIKKIIETTGASSIKDMGKVMGLASKELAGKADNKVVSDILKSLLS
ncbi:MAG TPA: GatB/YqeY domain-containing protein [Bacteroidales bacterium]|nr:GatB/YqeY domain-containing protein [Bacteroidales bacterium]HPS16386.1 GatB/YqeY domain-containing protein [Bacteroidales bacterium]